MGSIVQSRFRRFIWMSSNCNNNLVQEKNSRNICYKFKITLFKAQMGNSIPWMEWDNINTKIINNIVPWSRDDGTSGAFESIVSITPYSPIYSSEIEMQPRSTVAQQAVSYLMTKFTEIRARREILYQPFLLMLGEILSVTHRLWITVANKISSRKRSPLAGSFATLRLLELKIP